MKQWSSIGINCLVLSSHTCLLLRGMRSTASSTSSFLFMKWETWQFASFKIIIIFFKCGNAQKPYLPSAACSGGTLWEAIMNPIQGNEQTTYMTISAEGLVAKQKCSRCAQFKDQNKKKNLLHVSLMQQNYETS